MIELEELYEDNIYVDFKELYKYKLSIILRPMTNTIKSYEDFKDKWYKYYYY